MTGDSTTGAVSFKVVYGSEVVVVCLDASISYEALRGQVIEVCSFYDTQPFTMKWMDEENDPCTISSELELAEALRLYELNHEVELILHIFPNIPERPGLACRGEDRQMYRRGAKRWRKFYHVLGHKFQPRRFNRHAECVLCSERIWGLGRQGLKCINCKLPVHKRCYHFIRHRCGDNYVYKRSADNRQGKTSSHDDLLKGRVLSGLLWEEPVRVLFLIDWMRKMFVVRTGSHVQEKYGLLILIVCHLSCCTFVFVMFYVHNMEYNASRKYHAIRLN